MRNDISTCLIHFTKGIDDDDAYTNFKSIINSKQIFAGNECIKGGYDCICFTETPVSSLNEGFLGLYGPAKYSLFGVIFTKKWIFSKGGRPVIYQPDTEFHLLPDSFKWRHVRYDPISVEPIDFTWEREWRLNHSNLSFNSNVASLIVPNIQWEQRLKSELKDYQDQFIQQHSPLISEELLPLYRELFSWEIFSFV